MEGRLRRYRRQLWARPMSRSRRERAIERPGIAQTRRRGLAGGDRRRARHAGIRTAHRAPLRCRDAVIGRWQLPPRGRLCRDGQRIDHVPPTPEYNHGPSPALKNAIDFLHRECNNKAVGFVGYGGNGGARSVEILSQVVSNVELADMRAQVGLSLFTDFENFTTFKPGSHLEPTVTLMLDQVIAWGGALKPLRTPKSD